MELINIEKGLKQLIVIKRNGRKVEFEGDKIAIAIKKAFDSVANDNYTEKDANKVYIAVLKELYDKYNIGAWYDEADKQEFMDEEKFKATSIREIKDELRKYGYEINRFDEWDKESKDVVYAFQLHFNPKNPTGEMDLETFAILKALNKKYPD